MARHCEAWREVEIVCMRVASIQASQKLGLEDPYGRLPLRGIYSDFPDLIASANSWISALMSRVANNDHTVEDQDVFSISTSL